MLDQKKVYSFLRNVPDPHQTNDMDILPRMKKINLLLVFCLILLGACGVKPGQVSPPEGGDGSGFPRTYPDIRTDPTPHNEGLSR